MSDFNLRGIISLSNFDTNVRLSANCWVGKVFFAVFIKESTKPFTIPISDHSLCMLSEFVKASIVDKAPKKKKSIMLYEYDQIEGKHNHATTIIVGRDDKGLIFMEITNTHFPEDSKTNRFVFNTPKAMSIDDPATPDFDEKRKNEFGAKVFLQLLRDLSIAKIISRDKRSMAESAERFKQQRQQQSSGGSSSKENDSSDQLF